MVTQIVDYWYVKVGLYAVLYRERQNIIESVKVELTGHIFTS